MRMSDLGPHLEAWAYNTKRRIMTRIVRLLRLRPFCPCGWPLTQRFDGMWICGACLNEGRGYFDPMLGWQPRRGSEQSSRQDNP